MKVLSFLMTVFFISNSYADTRCGWIHNPTPGNHWLIDADGLWIISVQGGHQAEGDLKYPPDDQFVDTNRSYGYFCGCVNVLKVDDKNKISKFDNASSKLLKTCLKDEDLPAPK